MEGMSWTWRKINMHNTEWAPTRIWCHQACKDMAVGGDAVTVISSYDEITLCNSAFKTLRSIVNAWLLEVSVYKNVFADYQLIHFYRWLRSPSALLYDPALRRTLHTYMKNKLYIQLMA
ncbi:DNA polymerase epsilon catalytic subunit A-like [Temnothorax longispinosus]|uniref:DNA polymerase epsilon catalytic subunit A-like n=1 Tax=Temnothorax longispinosus TaxID=300112 RepID=UPI003A9945E7